MYMLDFMIFVKISLKFMRPLISFITHNLMMCPK